MENRAEIDEPRRMGSSTGGLRTDIRLVSMFVTFLAGCVGDTPATQQPDAGTADTGPVPDTGTQQDTGPDSAVFSPSSLGGLVLWLDASKGVTSDGSNRVTAWNDQSGKGNHATYVPNDASVAVAPLLIANGVNGRPAVQFGNPGGASSTARLQVADSASLRLGTGDFYVSVVAMWTNGDPGTPNSNVWGTLYHKADYPAYTGGVHFFGSFPDPVTDGTLGGGTSAGVNVKSATMKLNNGTWRQLAFVRVNGAISVRVNGTTDGTPTANATANCDATSVAAYIGSIANDNHTLQGKIAEMILVSGTMSSKDVADVESYFKVKYGL